MAKHKSLKEARETSGKTAGEIAASLGLSRSQLYRIESGECQASLSTSRSMRDMWPATRVPDIAIYDPIVFEERRG